MTIPSMNYPIDDRIPVNYVLLSVSDKSGLEQLVPGLIDINPGVVLLSTGGTYKSLRQMLGSEDKHLVEVAEYIDFPEMDGGLVKTLHPKIHGGILGWRHNPNHQKYLKDMNAAFIDMAVVNLYPFEQTISKQGTTFKEATDNIDIGGPSMVRGASKNFRSCAVVVNPKDYESILMEMRDNNGCTIFGTRFNLAEVAFRHLAKDAVAVSKYFSDIRDAGGADSIRGQYQFVDEKK